MIPGPGRPSNAVRERAAWAWEQRIPRLEEIADSKNPIEAIAAMRELRAVGFAEKIEHSGTVTHKHQVWKFGDKEVAF